MVRSSKVVNVGTKSGLISRKSYATSMELTTLENITVTPTFSWSASMSTTMKPVVEGMSHALFSWIWSRALWIPSDLVLLDKPFAPITSSSDSLVLATTGPRVITRRELSSLILFLMLSGKRLRIVIAYKHIVDFNFPRLADFGAAISSANKLQCQQVIEELDVHKRLQLTLELVKKEMEISKIQDSIAKAIEEKISGEQR
ncbi:hypothetical protein ERO13_D03G117533v2 [Gossypium hirsutum]|uniref:Lon protease homolog, mitochondrial isoform X2 n=1 Tax=Gossypium hirsutum TaxID=3635 RepID=A0ABM2ZU68_GOSHI|nr:lon protease homolog, mitochondrial-like isoform X2 [Gossypium hirsutum]KAG4155513.1 hypothetical protein ERO13_D03G117533v2 [Gossypium hirsutum]